MKCTKVHILTLSTVQFANTKVKSIQLPKLHQTNRKHIFKPK